MNRMLQKISRYFHLGRVGVRLEFPDPEFAEQADRHIFLADAFPGKIIATLTYHKDESVGHALKECARPNVVGISRKFMEDGSERLLLQMFDAFTVAIDFKDDTTCIRYPSTAPVRLLLDDVLQAAMQPVLDRIGGFILHGACMVRDERAIVFMGNSGAGKSTTAFNLLRLGFHCYADDAVLVTPGEDDALQVWPLSREVSLRPLSFALFERQGIPIGDYQREGQKYYFSQTADNLPGARLQHICFLKLSGDAETTCSLLTETETLSILSDNDRHFSFMGRSAATRYARILSGLTPMPIAARVGTDLHYQGNIFDLLFTEGMNDRFSIGMPPASCSPSRKVKTDLIRQAWSTTGQDNLADVIPLLADYDPHVFQLVLGFFQTFPIAKLQPVAEPVDLPDVSQTNYAPWVYLHEWIRGCNQLVTQSALEVLQRFAYSWLVSAPLLYPFLKVITANDKDRFAIIQSAWRRFRQEQNNGPKGGQPDGFVNGANREKASAAPVRRGVVVWMSEQEMIDWDVAAQHFLTIDRPEGFTIIPAVNKDNRPPHYDALVRHLGRYRINVKLTRQIPLCGLSAENAAFLLALGRFDHRPFEDDRQPCMVVCSNSAQMDIRRYSSMREAAIEMRFSSRPAPFSQCAECAMALLGLCRGGFLLE